MDKCNSDIEFDSYWDNEAKNQNRNRIRVGRQYQASIPPLLKPGQKDGRKSEELETLKWKPDQLSDQAIEEYLSMAKGLGLFSKSLDSPKPSEKSDNSLQSAIKGLSEFVTSHHPCHHDDGCKVPRPSSSGESSSKPTATSDWSPSEAQLFAQALESCGKNFGAIKKEYLPWKPIKSIIEYYYEGKTEKTEDLSEAQTSTELSPKKEESPSCSKDEKPRVKEELSPADPHPENSSITDDPPKDRINFLENARVTDPCRAPSPELKMSVNDTITASSTVGSLKFFLGGRLVLKLNAQQDSGSGTKCQWVQSNDLPKHSNSIKKERQRKKGIHDGSFALNPETHRLKKKPDDSSPILNKLTDCDPSAVKKPKLKSEYDFSENDKQGLLLCSSSWTPPIADGQESIEVDDGSSKTSEGYISPVLSNSRYLKTDVKLDNFNSELGEQKCDLDPCWVKSGGSNSSENCTVNHSASKNMCILGGGGKNSPSRNSDGSPYKQEVLNHKSALSHNKPCVKSLCYQPHASHSSSVLLKQWNKWPSVAYSVRTSPCSLSPVSVVDLKSPLKENPLDLSLRLDHSPNNSDYHNSQSIFKTKVDNTDKTMPSESESRPASCEFSPQSSNAGSLAQSIDSPYKETINSHKCLEDAASSDQCEKCLIQENSDYSPGKDSENSSQLPYKYCNLPYHCALPKCTKDYSLEEVPLDLSSANESLKEKSADSEKTTENVNVTISENSEAVEKGMLYQLLKSKTTK